MKRKIFRVYQKTDKMPEASWEVVFEREIDLSLVSDISLSTDVIMSSLRVLFYGEQYRIILIVK